MNTFRSCTIKFRILFRCKLFKLLFLRIEGVRIGKHLYRKQTKHNNTAHLTKENIERKNQKLVAIFTFLPSKDNILQVL